VEDQLETRFRAKTEMLWVSTMEEDRTASRIEAEAEKLGNAVFEWTCVKAFEQRCQGKLRLPGDGQCTNIDQALRAIAEYKQQRTVFIFRDLDLLARRLEPSPDYVMVVRRIKDVCRALRQNGNTAVFLASSPLIPRELQECLALVEVPLPDQEERIAINSAWIAANCAGVPSQINDEIVHQMGSVSAGMTSRQIQSALAMSVVKHKALTPQVVDDLLAEKIAAVKTSELMECVRVGEKLEDVGGLAAIKDYVQKRAMAFGRPAERYGLPKPKGVLIVGIPGTGKSLLAKVIASILHLALLRFDLGRVHASLVGESEARMRQALVIAESQAPVVIWIDEIEKAFAGVSGPSGDSGVGQRVFGTFLTWAQERTKPIFLVATANSVRQLPPEFLRKGRFDEIFFVDLPTPAERKAILEVLLRKYGLPTKGLISERLIEKLDRYTGAEIECVITEAMFEAFSDDQRPVTAKDLAAAATKIVPISDQMRDEIEAMRGWGRANARSAS